MQEKEFDKMTTIGIRPGFTIVGKSKHTRGFGAGVAGSTGFFLQWIIVASMNVARATLAGCGVRSAALSFGGYNGSFLGTTELYDGSVWTIGNSLNVVGEFLAGCGTQTAGLRFGGFNNSGNLTTTEKFNGSVWSITGGLNSGQWNNAGCGVQGAALSFGGNVGITTNTEAFNGTTWSIEGNLNVGRNGLAGSGIQTAGLSFGGNVSPGIPLATTERYDGVSWLVASNLNVARRNLAGCGSQTAGLSFGGETVSHSLNVTELYNGVLWSICGNLNDGRAFLAGGGIQTSGLSFGGGSGFGAVTEAFFQPALPVADFTGFPLSGNQPLSVQFTDTSMGQPAITAWSWAFGDGDTSSVQNPLHIYAVPGVYTVAMSASNALGFNSKVRNNYITVNAVTPVAGFTGTPVSGYIPLTVQFTDTSTNFPTSWLWDFGDGGSSTEQNPSHTYLTDGVYTVALTATNSAGSNVFTRTDYITAIGSPVAGFTGDPVSGSSPLGVQFTDTSTNSPTSWAWDFGDGGTSTDQNPYYVYSTPGTYTVKLTVTNPVGSDMFTRTDYITVSPHVGWATASPLNTTRSSPAGCGTPTSALAFGGQDSLGNLLASTEFFNGSLWSNLASQLSVARFGLAGCGISSAALAFGGTGSPDVVKTTDAYNGVSWSAGGDLITERTGHSGCGSVTAALAIGGNDNTSTTLITVEVYNGLSWAAAADLLPERQYSAACGSSSAALVFGGTDNSFNFLPAADEYDGVSWSVGGNINTPVYGPAGCGSQSAALKFGGRNSGFNASSVTESYDGLSWTTLLATLNAARYLLAGCGTISSALSFGGAQGSDGIPTDATEVYTL